jgi:hypothetical protein
MSICPLRVEELVEILAIQFDEEALPTFNADWRPEYAEETVMFICSSLLNVRAFVLCSLFSSLTV